MSAPLDPEDFADRLDKFARGELSRDEVVRLRDDVQAALRTARGKLTGEQLKLFTRTLLSLDAYLNQ